MSKKSIVKEREEVVIRFSGDSGDGMQLTGTLFSETSALFGNDLSTFPDYPAEIRAPQGTVGGVSGLILPETIQMFLLL
jgi:2-oxoglutarate ferredoxin oxidoreductase subunit alpha